MQTLWQDVRFGARMLVKKPGFTLIAVLTLALGIGLNSAFFSIINAILLKPVNLPELNRTVTIWETVLMIRQKDALGRYGGEEFALALRETPLRIAVDVAERIRSAIEKHNYNFDGKQIPVTISIGAATLDSTSKQPEDLIAAADKYLYRAKKGGRNRVDAMEISGP